LVGKGRFRVNVFQQRETMAAVLRYIPNKIVPLEDLNMPASILDFSTFSRGLVLITGPTGSGKSTTLASIINEININKAAHIITIEDPVEFVHESKKSIINQREVGIDTDSFKDALVNSLRQDPDVIMLGEMRDLETIQAALTAAETGHLVFATLHTQSVSETMSRIIDVFPVGAKEQVRGQLAATLQAIACQTLMKTLDGKGMVAAVEILKANNAIRALIRKNQDEQIRTLMETNKGIGMQTLDSHLIELVKNNQIDVDDALYKANNADSIITALGGEQGVTKVKRAQASLGGAKVK
jgi:twitching motility protein PilT